MPTLSHPARLRAVDRSNVLSVLAACALLAACAAPPKEAETEATEAVARAMFDAFNRHDLDALAALYAPDAVLVSPDVDGPRQGPSGARQTYGELFALAPDVQDRVVRLVADGPWVAVEFVSTGTASLPDGDRPFSLEVAALLEVRDGRIVQDRSYFDPGAFLRQVGLAE